VNRERGSVTLVVAALVAMILVLGLGAADLARALVAASRAQSAADAAALAAAQELALPAGREPADAAAEYAALNGAELIECRCAVGTLEATVLVRLPVGHLATLPGDRLVEAKARAVVESGA
jgi:secretion/DNA translocation related TadE-like protein